ncbi:MAG: hypothetical protein JSV33_09740 [bacterium]|nr:MAG: hypothetical protein JSV33_09740 [bacterium]
MKRNILKALLPLLLSLLIVLAFGCILDPKEDIKPPPDNDDDFKDLTDKTDVGFNLVESYKKRNIDKFKELLHKEYIWYLQDRDVEPGEENWWSRETDERVTDRIFDEANRLELTIEFHRPVPLPELGGEPCDDCWEISGDYFITAQFQPEGTIYNGNDLVKLIIVPVNDPDDGGRKEYRLLMAYDIEN